MKRVLSPESIHATFTHYDTYEWDLKGPKILPSILHLIIDFALPEIQFHRKWSILECVWKRIRFKFSLIQQIFADLYHVLGIWDVPVSKTDRFLCTYTLGWGAN